MPGYKIKPPQSYTAGINIHTALTSSSKSNGADVFAKGAAIKMT